MESKNPKRLFNIALFWDVMDLDEVRHKRYIISRVLDFGNERDIRILRKLYGDEEIINTIKRSRSLQKKTANFWSIYFNIPPEEIECLKRSSPKKQ